MSLNLERIWGRGNGPNRHRLADRQSPQPTISPFSLAASGALAKRKFPGSATFGPGSERKVNALVEEADLTIL